MKISYNWLKEYVDTDLPPQEIANLLTGCGLEVEAIEDFESVKGGLEGLIIGKVTACEKHPDADKLSITQVDIGGEKPLNIVCGAPNVAAGQHVVVATIGAVLYPTDGESFTIKKSKIRGVESEGMICAEDEIGLGNSHEGIMVLKSSAVAGTPAAKYFKVVKDFVFEIGLTPNRGDAASHVGVARDLAAVLSLRINKNISLHNPLSYNFNSNGIKSNINVDVQDIEACPRYTSLCISNVTVKESPDWLKNKLNAINIRPINNVVDATQYVLFELGQPLHAFDADKIAGKRVIVKKLADQTPFVTLDDVERKLSSNDLMICDAEKPMCIAGVFGGKESGVNSQTKNIFLESAYFSPVGIRKTSKYHGLKTDASFRYERGCNPNITDYAIKLAAILIQNVAGGEISEIDDFYPKKILKKEIFVAYSYFSKLIGKQMKREVIKKALYQMGIAVIANSIRGITVSVPTNKPDVTRPADVVEEFLRIYGYDNIGIRENFNYKMSSLPKNPLIDVQETISDYLSNNGFYETMNNSLTKAEYAENFDFINSQKTVSLLNPLSRDLQNMRQNLIFNSLENVIHNINHGTNDIKLYEFGTIYSKNIDAESKDEITKQFSEQKRLSICVTGKIQAEAWQIKQTEVDFYYLKNMVENAMQRVNISLQEFKIEINQSTEAMDNVLQYFYLDAPFITIGKVNNKLLKYFDIQQSVFYAEVDCDILKNLPFKRIIYDELNKFPEVSRDLALLVDKKITYKDIEDLAFKTQKKYLKSVNLFDVYEGDKIEEGKKSYAVRFILFDKEKTLTNNEINRIMDKFVSVFERELGAKLR